MRSTAGASLDTHALHATLVPDVARCLAGPTAASVMSGFGAEVTRVETPEGGAANRRRRKHTGAILRGFGYDDAAIATLRQRRIVASTAVR